MDANSYIGWLNSAAASHPIEAYVILFLSAFIENIFPPVPGDTVTVFAAYLVGRGSLELWPVIWTTFFGSTVGFVGLYLLGRMAGHAVLVRLGWVRHSAEKIDKAEALVQKHGVYVVAINRFLPGLRSVISLAVGMLRMPAWKVALAAMVSIFAWNGLLIWAGLLVGQNWERVIEVLRRYNAIVGTILLLAIVLAAATWWYRRRRG